MESRTVCEGPL